MTRGLALDHDFTGEARATLDGIIARRVARMVEHPCHAIRSLQRFSWDALDPPAIVARAEAALEQARSRKRGCLDFGLMIDLRAIAEYARRMEREAA